MSRIGRKAIPIPAGVKVNVTPTSVEVAGPKGTLVTPIPAGVRFEKKDGTLVAMRENDESKALHGLARSLVANAVRGVTEGFQKELEIVGVGYKAELKGKTLLLSLGYSHPIAYPIPGDIQIAVEKQTRIVVSGIDKQKVGQIAANLRALRPPDPYKQKGVRYVGEHLRKKAGKAGVATTK